MLNEYKGEKPDVQILQNRYFSAREVRDTIRNLGIGIDNAEFKRLWDEEVIRPPDVLEPWVVLWKYKRAIQAIKDIYELKGIPEQFDIYNVDEKLMKEKELRRYHKHFVDTIRKGDFPTY
jgi:hypothetical protein